MLVVMAAGGDPATRILDATVRLMIRHGSAKVAMVDVCREAEVSRGTLYRYFASRDELVAAMTARMTDHYRAGVKLAVDTDPRPERRFRVVVGAVSSFVNGGDRSGVRFRLRDSEFVTDQFRDHWAEFVAPIREAIVDAFPASTTRRHRRVSVAAELIAATVFAQRMLPTDLDEAALVQVLEAYAAPAS